MSASNDSPSCFKTFKTAVSAVPLPDKFTYPFYYEPHELSRIATKELQDLLAEQSFGHNFGLEGDSDGEVIGKMFGVLVVKNSRGKLGYLSAFSGKVGNSNHHEGFVPPVFDMLQEGNFFLENMETLGEMNATVHKLENDPSYKALLNAYEQLKIKAEASIEELRSQMRIKKQQRKKRRLALDVGMNATERGIIENELIRESLHYKHQLKTLTQEWNAKVNRVKQEVEQKNAIIKSLKEERKAFSNELQHRIFEEYAFLNALGKQKNLVDIFEETTLGEPPAGAGECAAPKLLHYAFKHGLQPIAMAEFWWGASPKSEIRKHGHFYPACKGKCEPILGHMLEGLSVDPNPMLEKPNYVPPIDIIYEDDALVVVNKPADLLSVPGKSDLPNMYELVRERFPYADEPMVVHRLDMATSGILVFTKTKEANKFLQQQFIDKTVTKRYVALLDGFIENDEGIIDLPLRLDLNDRPRQLVCSEHGKKAITHWKVINRLYGKTRIHFFPVTGRTHQLRVHAAHPDGLNLPIVGDDLYGKRDQRLFLHAEKLTFIHPTTREKKTITVAPGF